MSAAYLTGFGHYLPERVVGNAELAERTGKTPEWIENASGIRERRYAAPDEGVVEIGASAAEDCLRRTGITQVDLLIVSSGSASRGFPGPAAAIAQKLGLGDAPALDLPVASAGSLFGLALARALAPLHGNVLVVASEKMSELVADDPNTAILFGDGAGAALVTRQPIADRPCWRMLDAVLHSDGQFREELAFDGVGTLKMNGMSVILNATRKLPAVISEVLAQSGKPAAEVGAFVLHQANANLLARVAKSLNVDAGLFYSNIARYGNTSSASMLIAASEWAQSDPTAKLVAFAAFGAGYHWGALLAERV